MAKQLVIVGGGPSATNAVDTIRQFDAESSITLISDEPAHSRMALPYWLSGQIPKEQTFTADDDACRRLKVDARVGVRATNIDPEGKTVTLSDGRSVAFDELLLATGSRPADLPIPGADLPGVHHLWSLAHTEAVLADAASMERPRVVMIGAGFIGFIVLNAMYKRGWQLAVVERESHILPRMLRADASAVVSRWLASRHIRVQAGVSVQTITQTDDGKRVELADGSNIDADIVIVATGVQPNVELAQNAGLQVDHGILVDDHLRTSVPSIYAAGDVAQGPNLLGGEHEIHAIQPTAVDHGRVVGANMAGQDIAYRGSLSMNVLDVCGLQCASFGNWDDPASDSIVISNPNESIYRSLLFTGDRMTGAIFVGQANDVGMLTDIGMAKGMIQTGVSLGPWKKYLEDNPFDVRRAFIGTRVPEILAGTTLLGRPTFNRQFRYGSAEAAHRVPPSHGTYVNTKS